MDKLGLLKRKIRAEASRTLPGSSTIGRVTCSADWHGSSGLIAYAWKVDDAEAHVKSITEVMFYTNEK